MRWRRWKWLGLDGCFMYPEDEYDRIWTPFLPPDAVSLSAPRGATIANSIYVPTEVMGTAAVPATGGTLNFAWPAGETSAQLPYDIHKHFAELKSLAAEDSRIFNFSENRVQILGRISLTYLKMKSWTGGSPKYYRSLEFSVYMDESSTLPPLINAMQIYQIQYLWGGATYNADVEAMLQIKSSLRVQKNWMGDPCTPKNLLWEGLVCDYGINPYRVISVDLSSSSLTGTIPDSFASLSKLKFLDLSTNNLTGVIPKSLASLTNLEFLNITCNQLNNRIPDELKKMADAKLTVVAGQCLAAEPTLGDENSVKKKIPLEVVLPCVFLSLLAVVLGAALICLWRRYKSTKPRSLLSDCRNFTCDEIVVMTSNFAEVIGTGGNSSVYLGQHNKKCVAVKVLHQHDQSFTDEVEILKTIHHKYLIPLIGCCQEKGKVTGWPLQKTEMNLALVYEYMPEGTLAENLSGKDNKRQTLDWRTRLQIAYEAAQGLVYLHCGCRGTIIHRDIKATNILLASDYSVRIADFGISKFSTTPGEGEGLTRVIGTPGYVDPEYARTGIATPKSDVYSFGVILLELITGHYVIPHKPENHSVLISWVDQEIENGDLQNFVDSRLKGYSSQSIVAVMKLARECVNPISDERPEMRDVETQLKFCISLENDRLHGSFSVDSTHAIPVCNCSQVEEI